MQEYKLRGIWIYAHMTMNSWRLCIISCFHFFLFSQISSNIQVVGWHVCDVAAVMMPIEAEAGLWRGAEATAGPRARMQLLGWTGAGQGRYLCCRRQEFIFTEMERRRDDSSIASAPRRSKKEVLMGWWGQARIAMAGQGKWGVVILPSGFCLAFYLAF